MTSRAILTALLPLVLPAVADDRVQATAPAEASTSKQVLALVNGEPVELRDVERHLGRIHGAAESGVRSDFDLDHVMFRLVNDVLLGQQARALGMADEAGVADEIREYRERLAFDRLEQVEVDDRAAPSDEAVAAAYGELYRQVELRVVTAYDKPGADAMLAELIDGADMDALARERSVDPIHMRGGLMKPAPQIDLQREVAELAFSLAEGELGGPVRTDLGWTVFRVESFRDADPERFESLRRTVASVLRHRKAKLLRAELARRLRETIPVVVDREVVDPIVPKRLPDARLVAEVPDPEAVAARVGDRAVTAGRYAQTLIARWKGVRNEEAALVVMPIVLDRLIEHELLVAEALRRGYDRDPAIERRVRSRENELLVPHYLEEVVAAGIEVSTEEAQAYYEEHKRNFLRPPRLRLGQITVATLEEAERIAGLLRDGADLAWLARRHSSDRFAEAGGDRGWFEPVPGLDPYNEQLLTAETGSVIDPIGEQDNFIVTKVLLREERGPHPFERVEARAREAVFARLFREALDDHVTKLRERSEIQVFEERLAQLNISGSHEEPKEDGASHAHKR